MNRLQKLRQLFANRVARNILANYLGVVWLGGLSLLLIPVYSRMLGPSQWGLVAFCMTVQGFMTLLDAGLSQIMPRDIAAAGDSHEERERLYASFQVLYSCLGAIGAVAGCLSIPLITKYWIGDIEHPAGTEFALVAVLVQFLFQFSNNANIGYWNGTQQQAIANLRQVLFTTLKHVCAIVSVAFISQSALAYLGPFALVAGLEFLSNRHKLIHAEKMARPSIVERAELLDLLKRVGVISIGVIVGMSVSQLDRLFMSKFLNIELFGKYVIVTSLGLAFFQFQYPIVRAIFPSIVRDNGLKLKALAKNIGLVSFFCVLPAVIVAVFADQVLFLWTKDAALLADRAALLRLILLAVAINAYYNLIYQYMLASGAGGAILKFNLLVIATCCIYIYLFGTSMGLIGGGGIWLVASVTQLILGVFWISTAINSGKLVLIR